MRDQLREGVRSLLQDGRVAAASVCLLAITIGAITAIFAIVEAVVLRPLPFAEQERIVVVWHRDDRRAQPVSEVAYGEMENWRRRSRSFDQLAVVGSVNSSLTLLDGKEPQPVDMAAVSSSFFPVVGTRPIAGRWLEPDDDRGSGPRAMLISHGLWMRRFNGDPGIVGRAVTVQLKPTAEPSSVDIVGVMPPDFDYPRGADVWAPAAPLLRKDNPSFYGGAENAVRWLRVFIVLGRLRGDVALDAATTELTQVMRTMDREGGPESPLQLVVTPIADYLLGPAGPVLRTLLGGAALMLLIACANVAGLQVARAARRQRALAIRAALGASKRRLALQIVWESALLTGAALAAASAIAYATLKTLLWLAPSGVPRLERVALIDGRVLAFGAAATFVTAALCALWPVLVARRVDAMSVLAHGAGVGADPRGRRVQRGIVVAQIAVALTLLVGTGLFLRTVRGLDRTVLGFDPDGLLSVPITPATEDAERWNAFYDALIRRVEALPGVQSAGAVLLRPLSGPIGWDNQPWYPGQAEIGPSAWGLNAHMNFESVTPGYFRTMGIRLLRGRLFAESDAMKSPGVVVISESTARRVWPGRDPIGQRLREITWRAEESGNPKGWQTVVGVVQDVRYRGLNDVRLDLYAPSPQTQNLVCHLMVRAKGGDVEGILPAIRAAARALDSNVQVGGAVHMRDVVAAESAPWRFLTRVFVAFAVLAAVLAAVGLGVVIALTVAARRRELAIRAALGADAGRLRRLVLREAGGLIVMGAALGLLGALALGRGVSHVLIGIAPHDARALIAAVVVAGGAGVLAAWFPARRAARTDPMDALRAE